VFEHAKPGHRRFGRLLLEVCNFALDDPELQAVIGRIPGEVDGAGAVGVLYTSR
jgi:hypothetical protein